VVSNIAVVVAAMGLIALPQHAASYFERGVIRRFRASSVPATAVILAQATVCFGVAIAAAVVLLAAARPAYPSVCSSPPSSPPPAPRRASVWSSSSPST
jgi:ABC-2 type transport system permease protein